GRDAGGWVLGTVYATEGPSYRKAGAMMLFNDLGQQFGLLSGGCLEADIHRHARRALASEQALLLAYDGSDEDDLSFQLGIGCGGLVRILLQPVTAASDWLDLPALLAALEQRRGGHYRQRILGNAPPRARFVPGLQAGVLSPRGALTEDGEGTWLDTPVGRPLHLLVVGGGSDARPLVALASGLGWEVTLCDPRPANARWEYFPAAASILRCDPGELPAEALFPHVDAALVLAAGASRRFGAVKLLAPLDGRPLLARSLAVAEAVLPGRVTLVLGAHGNDLAPHAGGARVVHHPRRAAGRASSIAAGVASLGE